MAKKKETIKRPVGRPSKYKPEYCENIIEYFTRPLIKNVVTKTITKGDGSEEVVEEIKGVAPATIFGFAASIDVSIDTINEWTRVHPEFSDAVSKAKAIQANHLITNASEGLVPNSFAIFMMKNITNWVDKVESKVDATVKTYENLLDDTFKD